MVVEETPKSEEKINTQNPNPIPNSKGEDVEIEEGEIMGDDESKSTTAVIHQPHLLEHSWTFWFDNPSSKVKQTTWGSSMRDIYTFSTVEEFWSLYNNMHHPSKLAVGADFYCFKQNIEPKWEDPICATGGKWTMTFQKGKSDTCWLYTLLALIGEQFDNGDEICGVVVNVRGRQEKIALWTKNAANEVTQVSIGKQWKEFVDSNENIGFMFHEHAKNLDRAAKNSYHV